MTTEQKIDLLKIAVNITKEENNILSTAEVIRTYKSIEAIVIEGFDFNNKEE